MTNRSRWSIREPKMADVSYFQTTAHPVDDSYPYPSLTFRSNDGTFIDPQFQRTLAWAKHKVDTGQWDFFVVYLVWEANWRDTLAAFKANVGVPHPKMLILQDEESWGGKLGGDHSDDMNASWKALVGYLRSHRSRTARAIDRVVHRTHRRVGIYFNKWDQLALHPRLPRILKWTVGAGYPTNPNVPHQLFHQYSDREVTPPFGACDINIARGVSMGDVLLVTGLRGRSLAEILKIRRKPRPGKSRRQVRRDHNVKHSVSKGQH